VFHKGSFFGLRGGDLRGSNPGIDIRGVLMGFLAKRIGAPFFGYFFLGFRHGRGSPL